MLISDGMVGLYIFYVDEASAFERGRSSCLILHGCTMYWSTSGSDPVWTVITAVMALSLNSNISLSLIPARSESDHGLCLRLVVPKFANTDGSDHRFTTLSTERPSTSPSKYERPPSSDNFLQCSRSLIIHEPSIYFQIDCRAFLPS